MNAKVINKVLLIGCLYEVGALLSSNRVPTITNILKQVGQHPGGKTLLWLWCGYVSWHFLEPVPLKLVSA